MRYATTNGGFDEVIGRRRDLLVLIQPRQRFPQLLRCSLKLKPEHDLMDRDAGERECSMLNGVIGGAASNGLVVAFEVFGKNIRIQSRRTLGI